MRDDWDDGMSTVSHDEECEEEVSSPKMMRSESDDETSIVSKEDIFSSSDEGESPEEMNDSDEEADPWGVPIHEAAAELPTKHNELVQSLENGFFFFSFFFFFFFLHCVSPLNQRMISSSIFMVFCQSSWSSLRNFSRWKTATWSNSVPAIRS